MSGRGDDDRRENHADETAPGVGRRDFFRAVAGQAAQAASASAGAAAQGAPSPIGAEAAARAEAAGIGFGDVVVLEEAAAPGVAALDATAAVQTALYRSPYRLENDALIVLDQRRFPEAVVEVPCLGAEDAAAAIRDRLAQGPGTLAAVAAYGLAIGAWRRASDPLPVTPAERLAAVHADANLLVAAAPWVVPLRRAVDRVVRQAEALCAAEWEPVELSVGMRAEADAAVMEQLVAVSSMATVAEALLGAAGRMRGRGADGEPLRVLVHGPIGALAFGQIGPAVAALAAAGRGIGVYAWVAEGRPPLSGVRTAHELANAGIGHGLVPDSAVGGLLAAGAVDLVLLGALAVTPSGAVVDDPGAYAVAVLASRHEVPVYVLAPGFARGGPDEPVPSAWFDVTPRELVNVYVGEEGVVWPPFGPRTPSPVAAEDPA